MVTKKEHVCDNKYAVSGEMHIFDKLELSK